MKATSAVIYFVSHKVGTATVVASGQEGVAPCFRIHLGSASAKNGANPFFLQALQLYHLFYLLILYPYKFITIPMYWVQ